MLQKEGMEDEGWESRRKYWVLSVCAIAWRSSSPSPHPACAQPTFVFLTANSVILLYVCTVVAMSCSMPQLHIAYQFLGPMVSTI
jgi:hypothetical protein